MDLHPSLLTKLDQAGFKQISEIQELTLEPILSGKDIFAQAETGSGKTGAFVIPILEQILRDERTGEIAAHESCYVVLSPTRELAQQTHKVFEQFGNDLGITACCIIGGESIDRQKEIIGKGVHILVATPGRLVDLVKQKIVTLENCMGVVFDEADRLFDMGFKKDIEFILSKMSSDRQLIMLSATSNQDVLRTAYKFNSTPEELRLNEDSLLVDHIDHRLAMITREEKFPFLVNLLREDDDTYAIVFCNTQIQTHTVAEWLILMGFKAKPISGKMPQNKRTSLMEDFRSKKVTILVCTDVAARGLDVKNISLVVNYDLPQEAANYVHRIGRTGRAGEDGFAVSFCAHEDCEYLDPIYDLIDSNIEKLDIIDSDFATDVCRRPYIDRRTLKVSAPRAAEDKRVRNKSKSDNYVAKDLPQIDITAFKASVLEGAKEGELVGVKKTVELGGFQIKSTRASAMKSLKITDDSLLGCEELSKGSKKFLLFGPRKTNYKFYVKPIFKRILLPFLITIVKKAGLSLYIKVSYRPDSLMVSFSGKDDRALTDNNFELLNTFETIIKDYLASRLDLSEKLRIQVKCFKNVTKTGGDNRNKKEEEARLVKLAKTMRKKVIDTNGPVKLKPLNAAERRIIHQFFQNDKQVKTTSLGEGRYKKVELSLKN